MDILTVNSNLQDSPEVPLLHKNGSSSFEEIFLMRELSYTAAQKVNVA